MQNEQITDIFMLNENSIVSSLKYELQIWKTADVDAAIERFMAYCNAKAELFLNNYNSQKAKKTYLKSEVMSMVRKERNAKNIEKFGTANPKLADIMGLGHKDETFNHLSKEWSKY